MSFNTGQQVELLYSLPAAITKNTYTTIAAYTGVVGTNTVCSIPAGWAMNEGVNPVGRAFELKVMGTIGNTAAATFANAININPTPGTSTNNITINTAYTPTAAVTAGWKIEAWFTITAFATSTMTIQVNGSVTYMTVASGGAVSTAPPEQIFSGTWTALDPRVTQYVELFGTWSASNVANTTTVQQMLFYGLN
ncbi:MAG TPA: hypothetical protein VFB74_30770 [Kribbellaceae bacterium]|nr:hypothetical protein [Kribbellaceae bacterium]